MGCVLVTGAAGGIGRALVRAFADAGYRVVGLDRMPASVDDRGCHVEGDIGRMVADPGYAADLCASLRHAFDGQPLDALVNNAAVQVLGPLEMLDREAWRHTLDVNLLAPFFLAQAFLPELEAARGCILNISSIHARLTKPHFIAYATSKAALSGMTRAMAVEIGSRVRVNAIEPAAIDTPMLRAGFAGNSEGYAKLEAFHPSHSIGSPGALARLAVSVVRQEEMFAGGGILSFDGGIGFQLHDPACAQPANET